jgi:mono/diheme cytochrome c family protein
LSGQIALRTSQRVLKQRLSSALGSLLFLLVVCAGAAGIACNSTTKRRLPPGAIDVAVARSGATTATPPSAGAAAYRQRCAGCHGADGRPPGAGAPDGPRDLTDMAWQKSVDDTHIRQVVLHGGPAVGRSARMPGQPDLLNDSATVEALVAHVRALRQH